MSKVAGWVLTCGLFGGICGVFGQDVTDAHHAEPAQVIPTPAGGVNATPALWKVQGPHETVYLFGTVHVMKPDVHWQTAKVMDAFRRSETVYLEVAKLDDMAAAQPLVMQLGLDQAHPLSTKISAEDKDALDKAVKAMGMPGEQMMEPMQPWLAYMTLSLLPMLKSGYSPTSGVDMVISKMAKQAGKPVLGFETLDQQLHYLADFPQAEQVALLHGELQDLPDGARQMNEVIADWEKGDVEGIARMENSAVTKTPVLFKKLVADRNRQFADELAKVLGGEKTGATFVAIGAAHLAGPDSVQKDLEAKGFKVVREE